MTEGPGVTRGARRTGAKLIAWLLLIALFTLSSPAIVAAQAWDAQLRGETSAVATATRLSVDGDRTIFSLTTDRPILTRIFTLSRPYRIVIDVPALEFNLPAASGQNGQGLVDRFRYGLIGPTRARIVLDLNRPSRFVSRVVETDEGSSIFSLELEETRPEEFRDDRQIASEPDRAAPQPASHPVLGAARDNTGPPIVIIDPGHGGIDPGAVADDNSVEKDVTLSVGLRLREALLKTGAVKVVMTRSTDIFASLDERVALASELNADLFLSLHADAIADREAAESVRGATVYTMSEDPSDRWAQRLAARENAADTLAGLRTTVAATDVVRSILVDLVRRESAERAAHFREVLLTRLKQSIKLSGTPRRSAAFQVLKQVGTPALLIEIGYMSNAQDRKSLRDPDWQANLAGAISDAVVKYFRER